MLHGTAGRLVSHMLRLTQLKGFGYNLLSHDTGGTSLFLHDTGIPAKDATPFILLGRWKSERRRRKFCSF